MLFYSLFDKYLSRKKRFSEIFRDQDWGKLLKGDNKDDNNDFYSLHIIKYFEVQRTTTTEIKNRTTFEIDLGN
jgi:hypothetical protein